jgi:hypothetical protein
LLDIAPFSIEIIVFLPVLPLPKSNNNIINLKMASFLWQSNLPVRARKKKLLLARHDIHLPRASGQALRYTTGL